MKNFSMQALLLVLVSFLMFGCSSDEAPVRDVEAQLETLEGEVDFSSWGAMPVNAVLHVELLDVTDGADDPIVLATAQPGQGARSPYLFKLAYDPAIVMEGREYRLQAIVRANNLVIDNSGGMIDPFSGVPLKFTLISPYRQANPGIPDTISLQGFTWYLTELDGEPVQIALEGRPNLRVETDSTNYSGFAGCNRFTGSYELNGTSLTLGNAAVTRMACQGNMELEDRFLAMLGQVGSWRLEDERVVLGDAERNVVAKFALATQ